jgi:uncharacterized Zn finger protein (UPF0148 family)
MNKNVNEKVENAKTVSCDGFPEIGQGHAPITFEGAFRALCPLCAALAAVEEAEAEAVRQQEDSDDARLEEERDAENKLDAAREELEALANDAAELVDAAREAWTLLEQDKVWWLEAEEGRRLGAAITKIEKGNK